MWLIKHLLCWLIHVTDLHSAMGVWSAARACVLLLPGAVAVAASCGTTDRGMKGDVHYGQLVKTWLDSWIQSERRLPWKSRVLGRAQFEICSASHSGNEQCNPSPSRLTNHISVSDIGGPIAVPFYWSDTASLIYWLAEAGLDTSPLVFFWLVVVLSNCVQWYFQMYAGGRPSSWAFFYYSLPDPTAF